MWIHYYNIWHSNIFVQLTFTPYIWWNSQSVPRISWSIYQYDILFCHESHHAAACTAFACTCTCTRTQLQIIYTNIIYQCRPFDFLYESWRNLIDRDGVEYYRVFGISFILYIWNNRCSRFPPSRWHSAQPLGLFIIASTFELAPIISVSEIFVITKWMHVSIQKYVFH